MSDNVINILHLEDDPRESELQKEMLKTEGLRVNVVRVDTREAFVKELGANQWDLILADNSIPGFDGLSALKLAREKAPNLPFIFVSGTLGEEVAIESLKNGATDYVLKQRLIRLAPVIRRALHETEARKTQEAAEAKLRYQALMLESVTDIIVSTDLKGTIQSWNRAAEKAFGYTAEETIGRPVNEIVKSEYINSSKEEVDARINETGAWSGEVKAYHRDGGLIQVIASASIIRDEKGNPIGFLMMDHDISNIKRAEEKILHQLQHLTALRRIDQAIAGSLDVHLVLDIALSQVIAELNVDAAAVLLFDPVSIYLTFEIGKGFHTTAYQALPLRIGEGYAGKAALERRIIQVQDLRSRTTDDLRSPTFAREGFQTYLGIPLIAKGEIKGVLEIFNREPLQPDEEWLDFMETLAGQIAIAIDSTTLFTNLQKSNIHLIHAYDATIEGWSRALDLRDKETEGHTQRVTELTIRLARAMDIGEEEIVHIRRGALLHDIGKMGVPDYILFKPGKLADAEWEIMRKHPTFAHDMLAPISYLQKALDIPYCHHERWDGNGYPRGLKKGQIPLTARLFAIVDVFDALTSDRPYRPAWSREQAIDHISDGAGKDFDPQIVELFLQMMDVQGR